jgi:hypothetical protein
MQYKTGQWYKKNLKIYNTFTPEEPEMFLLTGRARCQVQPSCPYCRGFLSGVGYPGPGEADCPYHNGEPTYIPV